MIDGVGVGPYHGVACVDVQCTRDVAPTHDVDVVSSGSCGPHHPALPKGSRGSDVAGLRGVPRVLVPQVSHAIIVIIEVEVVLQAIAVEVAGPLELVNPTVVVVVLVVGAAAGAVGVLIGYPVVVVVHRVLVDEVAGADRSPGPRVDGGGFDVAVGADVSRVGALRVVDRPLEDAITVVVPVELVEDAVVIVVERVGAVAAVEALEEVVDSVVVVIEVIQVVDTVVVVVLGPSLLDEETVSGIEVEDGGVRYLAEERSGVVVPWIGETDLVPREPRCWLTLGVS